MSRTKELRRNSLTTRYSVEGLLKPTRQLVATIVWILTALGCNQSAATQPFVSFRDYALRQACFLSDGTLANASSGQLMLLDPVTDSQRYVVPASKKIVGVVCNPKKLQVLVRYEGYTPEKVWGVVSVNSGKALIVDAPFEFRGDMEYYRRNYNSTFFGVTSQSSAGRSISFSADGEVLAAYKFFGNMGSRSFISVFRTDNFSEIAFIELDTLLRPGDYSQFLALNAVTQQYIDVLASNKGRADQFDDEVSSRAVRWYFRDGRISNHLLGFAARKSWQYAYWDFNPLVGGFLRGKDGAIRFFGAGGPTEEKFETFRYTASHRFPEGSDTWILGENVGMTISDRYAVDGNTLIDVCPKDSSNKTRPYIFKVGQSDVIPMPCGSLDSKGVIAIDVQRGYIFNTSQGQPDRLLKIEDFSDVRKAHYAALQEKYGVSFRMGFVKAQEKERYVPSVSNSRTVSETLFYVGGQPVTRYKDQTTVNEGYKEKVDIYNVVYEVRNSYSRPLAIKFRVEGLAKSTSWELRTLSGGFWQGLLGGRFSSENVRRKENVVLPIKIEKTLILKPGETFKSKDVWGEMPANQNEVSIGAVDVQEVDSAWLDRLNSLLAGKVSPTTERIEEFVSDSRSSWASAALLELNGKLQTDQDKQRRHRLMQGIKIVSVSAAKDYDPDFENTVLIELENSGAENIDVSLQIGTKVIDATVPARGRKTLSISLAGVKREALVPVIKTVK